MKRVFRPVKALSHVSVASAFIEPCNLHLIGGGDQGNCIILFIKPCLNKFEMYRNLPGYFIPKKVVW